MIENVVYAIEESRNLEKMTFDDLGTPLEAHEQQKKEKTRSQEKQKVKSNTLYN